MTEAIHYMYTFAITYAHTGTAGTALLLIPEFYTEEEMIGCVFAPLSHRNISEICIIEAGRCGIYRGACKLDAKEEAEFLSNSKARPSDKSPALLPIIGQQQLTYYFGKEYGGDAHWTAFRDGFAMCARKAATPKKAKGG